MAIVLAYIIFFLFSTASTLQRRHIAIRRDTDLGQIDFAFRISFMAFILSGVLFFIERPHFNQTPAVMLSLALTCGVFGALSIAPQYIAQRHVEAGLTTLIGNIYTPVTIALSTLLLHESLNGSQIIGTFLLLIAVVLVSRKHRLSRWRFDRYFWLMVLSGLSLGICLVAERSLLRSNGITTAAWLSWGADALFLGIAALFVRRRSQYNLGDTVMTGILRFAQMFSWIILLTIVANLSLAASIVTFKIVLVFITGALFLHEHDDLKRKIIGSLIATAGLLLMI